MQYQKFIMHSYFTSNFQILFYNKISNQNIQKIKRYADFNNFVYYVKLHFGAMICLQICLQVCPLKLVIFCQLQIVISPKPLKHLWWIKTYSFSLVLLFQMSLKLNKILWFHKLTNHPNVCPSNHSFLYQKRGVCRGLKYRHTVKIQAKYHNTVIIVNFINPDTGIYFLK